MKSRPAKGGAAQADKRLFIGSLIIFLISLVMVGVVVVNRQSPTTSFARPAQVKTLEPQVIANLTSIPQSAVLTGELAEQVNQIQMMLNDCPAYSTERREQMQQHIDWLLNPSQLPRDMILALGSNPTGKLIVGMATYTLSDWGLKGRPVESCLLTIGQQLNNMLSATGETPFAEFGG
jgi:hypothetical protein